LNACDLNLCPLKALSCRVPPVSDRLRRQTVAAARPSSPARGTRREQRPLSGVRIVSLAQNLPGPLAVSRLVAEGATAVKIEPPAGDPMRGFCEPWHREMHRRVLVAPIDLKSAEGRQRLESLLAHADLLLTSQRPSALARLGITVRTLARRHPGLRWLNLVGDMADPERPGHDLTYQAQVGLVGREMPRTLLADLMGAERAVSAALLLLRRQPPCAGIVGLQDVVRSAARPRTFGLTIASGILGGALPAYGIYDTLDGRVAIAALEPHFRTRLYLELKRADGTDLSNVMRTRTARDWERWAARRDLPITRIMD
jgi:crotonobetainyl-CoA:carnitine CoA-transferase CaiB-like acyl-CoA transferase